MIVDKIIASLSIRGVNHEKIIVILLLILLIFTSPLDKVFILISGRFVSLYRGINVWDSTCYYSSFIAALVDEIFSSFSSMGISFSGLNAILIFRYLITVILTT